MPLLYYWRGDNYRRDLDRGAGFHLNQASPVMHQIELGDSLWAFTRISGGRYVLAAELVVRAKTINPATFRYGPYRIWGDLTESRYFRTSGGFDVEDTIRGLSCRTKASVLGRAFQGHAAVRRLTVEDHGVLSIVAQGLPLEPRARLLPEGGLESALLSDDQGAVRALMDEHKHGISEGRRDYLLRSAPRRNRRLVRELHELYEGRCQICLWDPLGKYGEHLCQGHHLRWLSRGGEDSLGNLLMVCPNHHDAIHRCDAPFDYRDFAFHFGTSREALQVDHHLGGAAPRGAGNGTDSLSW